MAQLVDLENALRRLERAWPDIVFRQTEVCANDITALWDQRISETGTDERGNPFAPYTQAYQQRKTKAGRFTGKVDFTLSGQMLASTSTGLKNIGTIDSQRNGANCVIVIGPRDQETRDKMLGNEKHRPGWRNPSKQEVDRVTEIRQKRIEEMLIEEYFTFS